jgi:HAD superfamily hydrolase (TIGR01484 family)
LGRPYQKELQRLAETYRWAREWDIADVTRFVHLVAPHTLIAVGSGGSLSAAHLAAVLHSKRSGQLATFATPLEFSREISANASSSVLLLSAGGRNADILSAFQQAVRAEVPWIGTVCGVVGSPLAKLARDNEFTSLVEYASPAGKDGFLATNSLLAVFTILLRAFSDPSENLPLTLEQLLGAADADCFLKATTVGSINNLVERESLVVLYSPSTKSAALDLESKLTEAALARVQLADYRNFGHGRHHWFAKRAKESALLALSTPEDRSLCDRTLAVLPPSVPKVIARLPEISNALPLQALVYAFALTNAFGGARGIDPGRPSVPEFGRKLYHLRERLVRRPKSDILEAAVRRKMRASGGGEPATWRRYAEDQLDLIRETSFAAVVFDYDGTLCSQKERFLGPSERITSQIEALLNRGVQLAIATGRGRSVRADLQRRLPKTFWKSIMIGYYNGSEIGALADDDCPDRTESAVDILTPILSSLLLDTTLQEWCKYSVRRYQITLEPRECSAGPRLWQRAMEHVTQVGARGVKVVSSTHSVDIVAPEVSKTNLVKALAKHVGMPAEHKILCIGDRGKWPGNDYELLHRPFALSTDEVSGDALTCWNFSPAGCRGTQATHFYLTNAKVSSGNVRLTFGGSSN